MKITINDKLKIYAIQQEFCQVYPYLKLEFVAKPHKVGRGSEKKFIRDSSKNSGRMPYSAK